MIKQAMNKAKEHGISDVTIDILLRLADLPEGEARERLEKLDLSFDMLEQLVPKYSLTETLKAAKPFLNALALPEEIFERYNSELSIGEQVRLAIAVQMSSNPDVLLLDEPFGDIDPISLRMITNSLKELNRKFGTTILVVSHQLDMIQELAHEAVLIDEGNIVLRGPPEEICNAFIELVKTE
jgi:methyl coenzyme M reductase system subunit A2